MAQTTNDDGQGHPFDLLVHNKTYLYTVVRAAASSTRSVCFAFPVSVLWTLKEWSSGER